MFGFARWLIVIMLGLSTVIPVAAQGMKMILFSSLFFILIFLHCNAEHKLDYWIGTLTLAICFSALGMIWSTYGLLCGNPGALRVLTVMCIYPIAFSLLTCFYRLGDMKRIVNALYWIGGILVLTQILYLLSSVGLISQSIYMFYNELYGDVAVFDLGDDYMLYTLPSVSSLLFFLPFFVVKLITDKKISIINVFFIACAIMVSIFSGRRAIYLTSILSLMVTMSLIAKLKTQKLSIVIIRCSFFLIPAFIVFISLVYFNKINLDVFSNDIVSIFNFSTDDSNHEREIQWTALLDGVIKNPIFGQGAGAAASYSRSAEQPWAYELYYVALLFQYGILGFACYVAGILYVFIVISKFLLSGLMSSEQKNQFICLLSGLFAFLIGSATNPYLAKFDYMWVIFIPVAIINSIKLNGDV